MYNLLYVSKNLSDSSVYGECVQGRELLIV